MVMNNLQLQNISACEDYGSITIGNSVFTDDVWDLTPYIPSMTTRDCRKRLRFVYIGNEDMKHTVTTDSGKSSHSLWRAISTAFSPALSSQELILSVKSQKIRFLSFYPFKSWMLLSQ
jgi:hypothetical protein